MAEMFARETGFNRGLGGSMHTFFTPFGIYPNNAIVGGSGSHRDGRGAVQARKPQAGHRRRQHRRRLASAAARCYEALNFAAMDQFDTAVGGRHEGRPAGDFQHLSTTSYGMGGQTMRRDDGLRRSRRVSAQASTRDQMHAERVDGYNPLAVIDAYRRKKELAAKRARARCCSTS